MKLAFLTAAALLGLGTAQATLAPTLTLAQQAKKADVIVRAVLGAPATVQDGGVTYLAYPLNELRETVAGDAASLPQHEGKPALFFLQGVQDLPTLQAGQEIFALLYARKLDSPLVGFNQGLYPVVNGSVVLNSVMQAASTATSQPIPSGTPAAASQTATPKSEPNAFPTDPAKFRDALRAARGNA